jgi:hypothetical protein
MAKEFLRVGFFRELHDDPSLPSIREAVRPSRYPDEERIVAYLEAGVCLAACGGVQHDVLDPSSKRVTSPDMVTDGVWLWPGELPYYVAAHGVKLPAEFVGHMRQNGWAVPAFGEVERRELVDRLGWKWEQ